MYYRMVTMGAFLRLDVKTNVVGERGWVQWGVDVPTGMSVHVHVHQKAKSTKR